MVSSALLIALLAGLSVALSAGFWIALAWAGVRAELLQFYGVFLVFFGLWAAGATIAASTLESGVEPIGPMLVVEIGFLAAGIALLALASAVAKVFSARARVGLLALVLAVLLYGVLVQAGLLPTAFQAAGGDVVVTQRSYVILLGPVMSLVLLALLWTVRRRQRDNLWLVGAAVIGASQLVIIFLPSLTGFTLALAGAAGGVLLLGLGLVEREIVRPIRERGSQLEALRTVTSAITSLRPLDQVLDDLTRYTAELTSADMAGIFLVEADGLALRSVRGLPRNYLGRLLPFETGVAGRTVARQRGLALEDYAREWDGDADLPFARDTFGAVLSEPLVHGGRAIGAVLAVMARNGRVFTPQDRARLQLLSAQGAVALQQSRLLAEQRALTDELEAGRQQLESVLSSTESPVLAIARDRHILFANPSARVLAAAAGIDLSAPFGSGLPAEIFPRHLLAMARELRRTGSYTYDLALSDRHFLCHVAPLGRVPAEGWVAVLNDVTELKALDRLKSDMMRMTSHDLKNPLQAAMANLELLRDDLYETAPDEARESMDAVDQQLQRMYKIISGILDTERTRGRLAPLASCPPARIIESVAADMRLFARGRGISLWTDCPEDVPDIQCDPEQFERALGNLVENGIKYTPSGGEVRFSARTTSDCVQFEVADTGVGIPPAVQPHVFERFYRGHQAGAEAVAGTGLGLSLVKAVVERHQGSVWFESEPGAGTRFFVRVPAAHTVRD